MRRGPRRSGEVLDPRARPGSVLNVPLLGGVHLFSALPLQKDRLYLFEKKLLGPLVSRIQPMVVDEEGLVFQPVLPAPGTDPCMDLLPDFVSEGSLLHFRGVFLATNAANRIHGYLPIEGIQAS